MVSVCASPENGTYQTHGPLSLSRSNAMICPRCTKTIPSDPGGIHTCTPTPLVHGLEARIAELEAAMERIIAGPYAGQFGSAVEVAAEALKR